MTTDTSLEIEPEPTREELSALIDRLITAQPKDLSERYACIYSRISHDPQQREAGVRRQLFDSFALAAQQGFRVRREHVFVDNDVSASPLSTDPRPGYDDMIAVLEAGEAIGIAGYSDSRIGRRAIERLALDRMCAQLGVRKMTCKSGEDDLTTASGRMVSGFKALVDQNYSEVISENVKRAIQGAAEAGIHRGPAPWGWFSDGSVDPKAKALIEEAIQSVLAGQGYSTIVRRWNDAGIKPQKAATWNPQSLKVTLRNPRLVGDVYLNGEPVFKNGVQVRGSWEPIIDRATWDRLSIAMGARGTARGRRGSRKYFLSGFLLCAVCDTGLYGHLSERKGRAPRYGYQCGNGHTGHSVSIDGRQVDDMFLRLLAAHVEAEGVQADQTDEVWPQAPELKLKQDKLDEARNLFLTDPNFDGSDWAAAKSALTPEINSLEGQRRAWLLTTNVPASTTLKPEEIRAHYDAGDYAALRPILDRHYVGAFVKPSGRGLRFDPERVAPQPR